MSLIWLLPAVVALGATIALVIATMAVAGAARSLVAELRAVAAVRSQLTDVRTDIFALADRAGTLRSSRTPPVV